MKFLLKIKHWQFFGIFLAIYACTKILTEINLKEDDVILFPNKFDFVYSLLLVVPFFCWLYSLGINLHRKLPVSVKMNLKRFKIFFFISIFYLILFYILIINIDLAYKIVIIPVHLFAMYCIFYCFYFIAKSLKSIELDKEAIWNENDYAWYFFLIWFFPFGIWVLQPKINKIFKKN
jgi:hypothetical protein